MSPVDGAVVDPAAEVLTARLAAALAPARGPVLVAGAPPALVARLAAEGGVDAVAADPETLAASPAAAGHFAAVVVVAPAAPTPSLAAAARALLPEGGLLWLAVPFPPAGGKGALDRRATVVNLSEAGFLIRREERLVTATEAADAGLVLWTAARDPFVVRTLHDGDEEAVLRLFHARFHPDRDHARWRWQYRDNPEGGPCATVAVAPDGELVAHYAGYPVRFWRELDGGPGRELPALHVGDTMTSPATAGVGRGPSSLLGRAVRHFYARFCAGRVAFNYGFNTGKIQRFSQRTAGARRVEAVPYRLLDLAPPPPALRSGALAAAAARAAGWRVERIARFDRRWDAFYAEVRGAYGFLVARDGRYLDWRYGDCPGAGYRIYAATRRGRPAGWAVFQLRGDRLRWGDALVDPRRPQAARHLLARAVAEAPEARRVEGWLTPRPAWWDRVVAGLGFRSEPEPQDLGLVYVPFGSDPGDDIRRSLYYTWSDGDLF
jgi:hypothetical protein